MIAFRPGPDLCSHLEGAGKPVGFGCVRGGAWRATRFFGGLLVGLQKPSGSIWNAGLIVGCCALLMTVLSRAACRFVVVLCLFP